MKHLFFYNKSRFNQLAGLMWCMLLFFTADAMAAQDLKQGMSHLSEQGRSLQEGIVVLVWVFGAWMGWKTVKGLEQHKEDKREMPIGKVFGYAITAVLCFALPEFMGMGVSTMFGSGATVTDVNSTTFSIAR